MNRNTKIIVGLLVLLSITFMGQSACTVSGQQALNVTADDGSGSDLTVQLCVPSVLLVSSCATYRAVENSAAAFTPGQSLDTGNGDTLTCIDCLSGLFLSKTATIAQPSTDVDMTTSSQACISNTFKTKDCNLYNKDSKNCYCTITSATTTVGTYTAGFIQVNLVSGSATPRLCQDQDLLAENCYLYQAVTVNSHDYHQCNTCNSGFSIVKILDIGTPTNAGDLTNGCIPSTNKVPNCATYNDDATDNIPTTPNVRAVVCEACISGYDEFSGTLTFPGTATAGKACIPPSGSVVTNYDYENDCTALTLQNGKYKCTTGNCGGDTFIPLKDLAFICSSIATVPDCEVFQLLQHGTTTVVDVLACVSCDTTASSTQPNLVSLYTDEITYKICIADTDYQLGRCNLYQQTGTTGTYYCKSCKTPYKNAPIAAASPAALGFCTSLQLIGNCADYTLNSDVQTTLGDDFLVCDACVDPGTQDLPRCTTGTLNLITFNHADGTSRTVDISSITAAYLIPFCTLYTGSSTTTITTTIDCDTCASGYKIGRNQADTLDICVLQTLTSCTKFDQTDPTQCTQCQQSIPLSTDGTCRAAQNVVAACQNLIYKDEDEGDDDEGRFKCITCLYGYDIDYEYNRCILSTRFCSFINPTGGACVRCIPGYTLLNKVCQLNPANCTVVNPNTNLCEGCSSTFTLVNGACVLSSSICSSTQYKDQNGNCQTGNVANCELYNSSGICLRCVEPYRFSLDLATCVLRNQPIRANCPPSTPNSRSEIINGVCISVDIHCEANASRFGGYCTSCTAGFYAYGGKCYSLT